MRARCPTEFGTVKGALAIGDTLPLAPTREFAAPILGRVGQATAEIVKDSDGRVQAGDEVGLSGLEQRYDEQLAGVKGLRVDVVRANGNTHQVYVAQPRGRPGPRHHARRAAAGPGGAGARRPRPRQPRARDRAGGRSSRRPATILAAASGAGAEGQNIATYGQYAPGLDLQGRLVARAAPGRADAAVAGDLPADGRRRRQAVQELLRLPLVAARHDHAARRRRELVQHRLHLVSRQGRSR